MHRLRRWFFRGWWNDHVRSLLRAFLQFASGGMQTVELPAGAAAKIVLSSSTLTVESEIGLSDKFDLPEDLHSVLDDSVDVDDESDEEDDSDEPDDEDAK